jgi:hypothetical protein
MRATLRFPIPALAAWLLLGSGSARADIVTEIDGSFVQLQTIGGNTTNTAISVSPSSYVAAPLGGTGTQSFYLTSGSVTTPQSPNKLNLASINSFLIDISAFSFKNPTVGVTNSDDSSNPNRITITEPVIDGSGILTHFSLGTANVIAFSSSDNTATITAAATFLDSGDTSNDFSMFNAGGGGVFTLNFANVLFVPNTDGQAFFPVDPTKPVVISWHLQGNLTPVPEPASAVGLLTGAGLLLGAACRRFRRT